MSKALTFYVYEHWRTDRDECFYVGKGNAGRAYRMTNRNLHHRAVQAKVKREGFAIEVRIVKSGLSEIDALNLEQERILFWRQAGVDLTNVLSGGVIQSGHRFSEEARKNISLAKKGKLFSDEHKKNLREARKNILMSGDKNPFFGKRHSEETKALLSKKKKGLKHTDEHNNNVSLAIKQWWAQRKRNSENEPVQGNGQGGPRQES